jgi:hypothetical protein
VNDSGLEALKDVQFIAPGDFNNDGLPDLCVITSKGAALYRNTGKGFVKQADLAAGSFRKAVWMDDDHDYDEDIILIGDDSRLLRNNGEAGFSDETGRFPFVAGKALDAVRFDLEPGSTWWSPTPIGLACCIAISSAAIIRLSPSVRSRLVRRGW